MLSGVGRRGNRPASFARGAQASRPTPPEPEAPLNVGRLLRTCVFVPCKFVCVLDRDCLSFRKRAGGLNRVVGGGGEAGRNESPGWMLLGSSSILCFAFYLRCSGSFRILIGSRFGSGEGRAGTRAGAQPARSERARAEGEERGTSDEHEHERANDRSRGAHRPPSPRGPRGPWVGGV